MSQVFYANTDAEITRVVEAANRSLDRGDALGYDSEFFGVDIGKQSCFARSQLHLCSLAVKRHPYQLAPRGYHVADAAVFSRRSLERPDFVKLLENPGPKAVHNLPVDAHTLANAGITLGGGVNTLAMARWAWPERARGLGFTLDALGQDLVGAGKTEDFRELFRVEVTEYRVTTRREKVCECGQKCGRRSTTPGHTRHEEVVETRHPKLVMRDIPLESVVPGHPLWPRAINYAAQDAWLALAVYDLATLAMQIKREIPW